MKKIILLCISSLGCAKNLVDTEVMLGSLSQSNISLTDDMNEADIYVINTCSFIESARQESNQTIADGVKWKKKKRGRKLVVAGCLPQRSPQKLNDDFPDVDLILGLDQVANLNKLIDSIYTRMPKLNKITTTDLPVYLYDENTPRLLVTPSHYAYIKISEGCNHKCSFCAIPTFRGKLRSRTITSIVKEAQNLLNQGVRELILVSQDSTGYGSDLKDGSTISKLLQRLEDMQCQEDYWIRLLYLYPTTVNDELIDTFANSKHIVKYIDMPLQHIADDVLKTMRRGITKKRTIDLLAKFRQRIPDVIMRTTLLVGHPGESEESFQELVQFVEQQKFDRIGVFTYSHEQNTWAHQFDDYPAPHIAQKRKDILMEKQYHISYQNNQKLIGKKLQVIIDDVVQNDKGESLFCGRSYGDAPDVDNLIYFPYDKSYDEKFFADVKVVSAQSYDLIAETIKT